MLFVLTVILTLYQGQRNCNWKSLWTRTRAYLVGQHALLWQWDINSWLSSQRLGYSQLWTQRRRVSILPLR